MSVLHLWRREEPAGVVPPPPYRTIVLSDGIGLGGGALEESWCPISGKQLQHTLRVGAELDPFLLGLGKLGPVRPLEQSAGLWAPELEGSPKMWNSLIRELHANSRDTGRGQLPMTWLVLGLAG
ncbi:hypothetical protein NDU88_003291 [Pleurodeles waltl]|uniref:Uncharacterized protein n=1 Tax=Pleurodeles waltl TaxID=8319 RepID=A0AAV7WR88_PLEWA|nr:hypothetical protein NDU88_003291 [Pleurodeles waltl]